MDEKQHDIMTEAPCFANYDYQGLVAFARKKFLDGKETVELLQHAHSEAEKEMIMLVSLLDIKDENIHRMLVGCDKTEPCVDRSCREVLRRKLIDTLELQDKERSA